MPWGGSVRRAATLVLDALLPPQCLGCGTVVREVGSLCSDCWERIEFIGPPQCETCGYPFEYDVGEGALCASCAADPPLFRRARAVFRYDEKSRNLVLGFKHGDRTHAAPAFGRWLARAGAELLTGADLLAPVPLHRWRLFRRRYNQSALLAHAVAKQAGKRLVPDLLVRRKWTRPQGRLTRSERLRNVKGAFALRAGLGRVVEGRCVLLVDDVYTTGATVSSCAEALLDSGAAGVDVLTLARVVRPVA